MNLPKLTDFDLKGKTILVRADLDVPVRKVQRFRGSEVQRWEVAERKNSLSEFNVPATSNLLKENFYVADDTRLKNCLPTIEYLLEKDCRVVVMGHLGRPEGKAVPELSLEPVARSLTTLLNRNIVKVIGGVGGFGGGEGEKGKIVMVENLRFWPGEEANDEGFARRLANLGDFYVNECFSSSHRRHASFVSLPELLPHAAGFHLIREVEILSKVLRNPKRPVVIVIGGAKEDKLKLIPKFLKIADFILIGGWLLKRIPKTRRLADGKKIFACLTKDGKDITVESAKRLGEIIKRGGTVVWNGPMGIYEDERDIKGTKIIAEAIVNSKAFKIAGGGDTEAVIDVLGLKDKFDWISSGGGAMLEFLAEGTLGGLEALKM